MNLASLASLDVAALLSRVLDEVLGQIQAQADLNGRGHLPPETIMAEAIANWVMPTSSEPRPILRPADAARNGTIIDVDIDDFAPDTGDALGDRRDRLEDLVLALGACDCWGEDRGCIDCRGRGRPGWQRPDRSMFREYVQPALTRLAADKAGPAPAQRNIRTINATERNGHARHT